MERKIRGTSETIRLPPPKGACSQWLTVAATLEEIKKRREEKVQNRTHLCRILP